MSATQRRPVTDIALTAGLPRRHVLQSCFHVELSSVSVSSRLSQAHSYNE